MQGGGEQGTSALEVPSSLVTERHLEATRSIPDDADLDLVLWPENTIDVDQRSTDSQTRCATIAAEAERLDAPIAVGVTEDSADGTQFVNAQIVVSPERHGRTTATRRCAECRSASTCRCVRCSKRSARRSTRSAATRSPAPGRPSSNCPTGPNSAVVISWEVFFGGRAREGVKLGAEAILNPTNGSSYTGTIVQTQQVASSRLRAVENGRWVVQAAPTGFSAVIDDGGDVLAAHLDQRTSASLYTDVELRDGTHLVHEPRRRPDHRRADRRAARVDVVRRPPRPPPPPSPPDA